MFMRFALYQVDLIEFFQSSKTWILDHYNGLKEQVMRITEIMTEIILSLKILMCYDL